MTRCSPIVLVLHAHKLIGHITPAILLVHRDRTQNAHTLTCRVVIIWKLVMEIGDRLVLGKEVRGDRARRWILLVVGGVMEGLERKDRHCNNSWICEIPLLLQKIWRFLAAEKDLTWEAMACMGERIPNFKRSMMILHCSTAMIRQIVMRFKTHITRRCPFSCIPCTPLNLHIILCKGLSYYRQFRTSYEVYDWDAKRFFNEIPAQSLTDLPPVLIDIPLNTFSHQSSR